MTRPVMFHERTGHSLNPEHNALQLFLDEFSDFTQKNLFKINQEKSNVMMFNFSQSLDFQPNFNLGQDNLNLVDSASILGLKINSKLTWDTHIQFVCNKARKRIWALRRLMELKLDYTIILDFYHKEVRSILEYGAVVFHSSLTQKQSDDLEAVQRGFFQLLSHSLNLKLSYSEATILFASEKLVFRRTDICKKFVKRNLRNPRHSDMFKEVTSAYNTRMGPSRLSQYKVRTARYARSPKLYLNMLADQMRSEI